MEGLFEKNLITDDEIALSMECLSILDEVHRSVSQDEEIAHIPHIKRKNRLTKSP